MLENVPKWLMVIIAQDGKDTVNPICPELWSGVLQKATYIFELYLLIRAAAALLIEFFFKKIAHFIFSPQINLMKSDFSPYDLI